MQQITSLDDPRLAAYRNLRDRSLQGQSLFVAEGLLLVERLLASDYATESILAAESHADRFRTLPDDVPVYIGSERLLSEIVGFEFHRGVLAAGRRGPQPGLDELLANCPPDEPLRLVVGTEITLAENLGAIFRTAAAFGIDAIVLGPGCGDPLSRRCLRVSMGGSLRLPFARSGDLGADLVALKRDYGVELVATVVDPPAHPLADFVWPRRAALLLGNEYAGVRPQWLKHCDHRVMIPMRPGTDSLNVGVAMGICLYEMTTQ